MRSFALDEQDAVFAFRGLIVLALGLMLLHGPRMAESFRWTPFALAVVYLATSGALWRARSPRLQSSTAQAAAYLWDVAAVSALVYFSEGFDGDFYLMYFLIMFMAGLLTQVGQSFLIGTVSSLVYAGLWLQGKAGAGLPAEDLLLRFAFFYVTAFFTAVIAVRARGRDRRAQKLSLRLALGRLANGGWGLELDEEAGRELEPGLARSVRTVNALMDNLAGALKRTVAQNAELHEAATAALLQLAREKERLEALARERKPPAAPPAPPS